MTQERVLDIVQQAGVKAVIPAKANHVEARDYDTHMYPWRQLIENVFQKRKQYRAIATREPLLLVMTSGLLLLAVSIVLLRLFGLI